MSSALWEWRVLPSLSTGSFLIQSPLTDPLIRLHGLPFILSSDATMGFPSVLPATPSIRQSLSFGVSRWSSLILSVEGLGVSVYDFTYEIWINDANDDETYFVAYFFSNYEASLYSDPLALSYQFFDKEGTFPFSRRSRWTHYEIFFEGLSFRLHSEATLIGEGPLSEKPPNDLESLEFMIKPTLLYADMRLWRGIRPLG